MIQIKNWLTGKVIFEAEVASIKLCVELAVSKGTKLNFANLRYAELSNANLNYAKLNGAKLNFANLNYANLRYAKLSNAKLNNAKLNFANLRYAKLSNAELSNAELSNANLRYAELSNAELSNAKLNNARLNNAELVRIDGLKFSVIISQTHVHIGCKRFTKKSFRKLDLNEYSDHESCFNQYPIVIAMLDALGENKDACNNIK